MPSGVVESLQEVTLSESAHDPLGPALHFLCGHGEVRLEQRKVAVIVLPADVREQTFGRGASWSGLDRTELTVHAAAANALDRIESNVGIAHQ